MSEIERERERERGGEREREKKKREGTNTLCSILIIEYLKYFCRQIITKGLSQSDIEI